MDTRELIIACKRKNRKAEKELFLRFAGKILTLCRRYVRDEHKAQDFMQECFAQLFREIGKYDESKGVFEAWMYRVSTNTVLQLLRKSKKEIQLVYTDTLPEQDLEEDLIDQIPHEKILEAIRALPTGYRKVFNLFIFEGWTHREIAKELNIKEGTSQSQLVRAKKLLKFFLQKNTNFNYEKKSA